MSRTGRCSSPSSRTRSSPTASRSSGRRAAHALDLEVELGVVIGRRARRVSLEDALRPRRRLRRRQRRHRSRLAGQRGGAPRGPEGRRPVAARQGQRHVPADGPGLRHARTSSDPAAGLRLRSWRIPGSARRRRAVSSCRTGRPPTCSSTSRSSSRSSAGPSRWSRAIVIATGTPAGVGVFRDPPVFLEPGDRVRCEIEGIGSVENPIVDWSEAPAG